MSPAGRCLLYQQYSCSHCKEDGRIRIYLLARKNLLWDILRLPNSSRAALGTICHSHAMTRTDANQPSYALLHRSSPYYTLRHGRRRGHTRKTFFLNSTKQTNKIIERKKKDKNINHTKNVSVRD